MQQLRGMLASNAALVTALKQVAAEGQPPAESPGEASPRRFPRESSEDQSWQYAPRRISSTFSASSDQTHSQHVVLDMQQHCLLDRSALTILGWYHCLTCASPDVRADVSTVDCQQALSRTSKV